MIHSSQFIVVLDTNVIYPVLTRDILLWYAHYDLYTPKWSETIFTEWIRVMKRKDISSDEIKKRTARVNEAFEDALVTNYQPLIEMLELPDENDRHVLAAAIKTNPNVIVTNNISDFPEDYLTNFSLSAKTADDFLTDITDLNPHKALRAFREMVLHKSNPDLDEYEVLDRLRKNGLKQVADYLHSQL